MSLAYWRKCHEVSVPGTQGAKGTGVGVIVRKVTGRDRPDHERPIRILITHSAGPLTDS